MHYEIDPAKLEIYLETRRRRILVGVLSYDNCKKTYTFEYEKKYLLSKSVIAVGPDLPMNKLKHISKRNRLFPTFLDRIPSRENPAYDDYCKAEGVATNEDNPIILLTTIGRRGPSDFIYEPVFRQVGSVAAELKTWRLKLELSQWDVAMLFDIPLVSLQKIEAKKKS